MDDALVLFIGRINLEDVRSSEIEIEDTSTSRKEMVLDFNTLKKLKRIRRRQ